MTKNSISGWLLRLEKWSRHTSNYVIHVVLMTCLAFKHRASNMYINTRKYTNRKILHNEVEAHNPARLKSCWHYENGTEVEKLRWHGNQLMVLIQDVREINKAK